MLRAVAQKKATIGAWMDWGGEKRNRGLALALARSRGAGRGGRVHAEALAQPQQTGGAQHQGFSPRSQAAPTGSDYCCARTTTTATEAEALQADEGRAGG